MDSLTYTAIRNETTDEQRAEVEERVVEHGRWRRADYLLAGLIDAVHDGTWVAATVAGAKIKPPSPVDRPGLPKPKERVTPEGWALMQKILANGGGVPLEYVQQPVLEIAAKEED